MFTMLLLIITSCVSMQLFCFLGSSEYKKFDTFDQVNHNYKKIRQKYIFIYKKF
jgi:hypothetical protein